MKHENETIPVSERKQWLRSIDNRQRELIEDELLTAREAIAQRGGAVYCAGPGYPRVVCRTEAEFVAAQQVGRRASTKN